MGRLFHSLPEGPLCTEEHLLLGHFRGALVSQLLPTQQAGLVSSAPPTHPALQEQFREKIDTCTSLEKAPSVVFSTGPLSSPRKENNVWTDNSGKHHDHSCTAPAVRWILHTSFPQASDPHDCLTHPAGLLMSSCYRCRNPVERVQNRQTTSQWGRTQAWSLVRTGVQLSTSHSPHKCVDPVCTLLFVIVFHFTEQVWAQKVALVSFCQ